MLWVEVLGGYVLVVFVVALLGGILEAILEWRRDRARLEAGATQHEQQDAGVSQTPVPEQAASAATIFVPE